MGRADELVDVVDDDDAVVAVVTRREMRARVLRHRTVFVLVCSSGGNVLVHRRSEAKDVWPGRWDLAAGGVLASGEGYAAGAARELAEELGIDGVALMSLGRGRFESEEVAEMAAIYRVTWDGPVRFVDGEVTEARWVSPGELRRLVRDEAFVPDSVELVLPFVAPLV